MRFLRFSMMAAVASIAVMAASVGSAKADYGVWTDAKTGLTVTFPDTWKQINNETSDDVITLSVASGDANAICKISAQEDKRFLIYPNKYRADIRDKNFAMNFWEKYATNYNSVKMIRYADNAGLGQGFASMALVSFLTPPSSVDANDSTDRGGIMAVTNYGDKVYVANCSSALPSYGTYHVQFMDFFKSISFKKYYHELVVGDYRNFLNEMGTIDVPFPNAVSRSTY
jgi:hypothetical protein